MLDVIGSWINRHLLHILIIVCEAIAGLILFNIMFEKNELFYVVD